MSAKTTPILELASDDWQLAEEDSKSQASLVVQLRRRVYLLPWFHFIYAEGDNAQVRIAFASHVVTVSGHGLQALLTALAMQSVTRLVQPTESEVKFGFRGSSLDQVRRPFHRSHHGRRKRRG